VGAVSFRKWVSKGNSEKWLAGFFLLLVGVASICTITETDIAWYLRSGAEILRTWSLPEIDPFSFTSSKSWLNHEWLTEIVLVAAHRAAGIFGLGMIQAFLLVGIFFVVFYVQKKQSGRYFAGASIFAYVAAALILREIISPRAQFFSNLLFAVAWAFSSFDFHRARNRASSWNLFLWLVPLGILWTQFQGGNPHLVILMSLLWLSHPEWRRAIAVGLAALLSIVGPYGMRVHEHFFHSRGTIVEIKEWQPFFNSENYFWPSTIAFVVFIFVAGFSLLRRYQKGERVRFEALSFCFFLIATLFYRRFMHELTIVSLFVMVPYLSSVWTGSGSVRRKMAIQLLAGMVFVAGVSVSARKWGFGFDPEYYPVGAVQYLKEHRLKGPMFNSYNFGGYLMWEYPDEKVFIDGRAFTVYADEQIESLVRIYNDPEKFLDLDARYGFRLAVLKRQGRGARFFEWLKAQDKWRVVYEDPLAAILVAQ
jgi:hypothetical protein